MLTGYKGGEKVRQPVFTKVKVGRVVLVGWWVVFPSRGCFCLTVMVI